MFNTEDGGNTILFSFLNCVTFHNTRTVSTQHQHNRQNLKWGTLRPVNWTGLFVYRCCPTNQVSYVRSQCKCVNGCSVLDILMAELFQYQKSKFLHITAVCLTFLKTPANCCPSQNANPPVWFVFRRHITEMCEFLYKKREKIFILFR